MVGQSKGDESEEEDDNNEEEDNNENEGEEVGDEGEEVGDEDEDGDDYDDDEDDDVDVRSVVSSNRSADTEAEDSVNGGVVSPAEIHDESSEDENESDGPALLLVSDLLPSSNVN